LDKKEVLVVLLITLLFFSGSSVYSYLTMNRESEYMQAYDDKNKEQTPWYKPPSNSTTTNSTEGG